MPVEVLGGCCWLTEPKRLVSEIRSEDRWTVGWENGRGEDVLLPLPFLLGEVGVTGETGFTFSSESPPLISKLEALPL